MLKSTQKNSQKTKAKQLLEIPRIIETSKKFYMGENQTQMNFAKGSIEFLTVAVEICKYLECEKVEKQVFLSTMTKLLPLVYMKASMVELREAVYEDDVMVPTVEECEYEEIKNGIANLLGEGDQYLTAVHPDIAYSDTTIAAFISEDLADVYQMLKEFVNRAKTADEDLMNDALIVCIEDFKEYWGVKLLNAQLSMHLLLKSINE